MGGGERVCEEKRTRSHAETNAFASGDERGCTRTQTRVRYTLHLNGTVSFLPGRISSLTLSVLMSSVLTNYVRVHVRISVQVLVEAHPVEQ